MKKTAFILLLLLAAWTAGAQNASRIRRDAAYLSAEGKASALHAADSAALAGLAARIAARTGLSEAVGATYLEDLRRVSSRLVEGRYTVLRYLETGRIEEVSFFGDFMATAPLDGLTEALRGVRLDAESLAEVLDRFDLPSLFGGIRKEEVLSLLLDENILTGRTSNL